MMRHRIIDAGIAAQGPSTTRDEFCRRCRVAAGEQHHIMAASDELLGQPGNDTLGSPIAPGWHRFIERCELRNSHGHTPLPDTAISPGPTRSFLLKARSQIDQ